MVASRCLLVSLAQGDAIISFEGTKSYLSMIQVGTPKVCTDLAALTFSISDHQSEVSKDLRVWKNMTEWKTHGKAPF